MVVRVVVGLVASCAALACGAAQREPTVSPLLSPSWRLVEAGPGGGSVWRGPIANGAVPDARRETLVYLPPGARPDAHYPLVVLLHGFPGGPYSYTDSLELPQIADALISSFAVPPFVAVIPPAGVSGWYDGEWAGPWESFLLRDVLPWAKARLPVARDRRQWAIAGLSAGGYGAADVALRHPRLFGTVESWSGYFGAPRDGPLHGASRRELLMHDPSVLAASKAPLLRRLGTRFFVESATTQDRASARRAVRFARELRHLGLPYRLLLAPGGHDGAFWRAHLATALRYALAPAAVERTPAGPS